MTVFKPHPNNVSTTLASTHAPGSGTLVLASGTGAAFGSTFPLTVTVAQAANVGLTTEVNTIFTVTGRSSDTLTGVSAAEGTADRAYAIGDRVECRWTSGLAAAVETAVNALENTVVYTSGNQAIAGIKTFAGKINIDGAAGSYRDIWFTTAGVQRWIVRASNEAETGSNAGSNFELDRACRQRGGGERSDQYHASGRHHQLYRGKCLGLARRAGFGDHGTERLQPCHGDSGAVPAGLGHDAG